MTFLDDLRAANPAPGESPYGEPRAGDVIADITSGRVKAPPPPPVPSRRPWLVGGIAVAAAATLAGVLIIPPVLRHDAAVSPGLPVPTSRVTVPRQPTPTSTTQYWKTVTTGVAQQGASMGSGGSGRDPSSTSAQFAVPFDTTTYTPVDPSGRTFEVSDRKPGILVHGSAQLPSPKASHSEVARPTGRRVPGSSGSWQTPGPAWFDGLPREVSALRARLYADARPPSAPLGQDAAAFGLAVSTLHSEELPADLRALVMQVVATIPGASVGEPIAIAGQRGIPLTLVGRVVSFDGRTWYIGRIQVVLGDPGLVLRVLQELTEAQDGMPAGTVVSRVEVVSRDLVDAVPAELAALVGRPCGASFPAGGPTGCDVGATSASTPEPTPVPASR